MRPQKNSAEDEVAAPGDPPRRLPGLDGLRFLAAFAVFFGHLEQAKSWNDIDRIKLPSGHLPYAELMAADAVSFFFVLSGFLITYLLLREEWSLGSINVKNFYIRRSLRIWPLYYFVVFLSFFILPRIAFLEFPVFSPVYDDRFVPRLLMYVFMLPQLSTTLWVDIPVAGPLWSIGVEEIFYLAWPPLLKLLHRRALWGMIGIILLVLAIRTLPGIHQNVFNFFYFFRINCMALGGIGAWIFFNRPHRLKLFFRVEVQVIAIAAILAVLFIDRPHGKYHDFLVSVPFLILILNVALNPKTLVMIRNRAMCYLGEISYGLYAYHWLCIIITVNFFLAVGLFESTLLNHLALLVTAFALTVSVASASYFLFEKRFLNRKKKFYSHGKPG